MKKHFIFANKCVPTIGGYYTRKTRYKLHLYVILQTRNLSITVISMLICFVQNFLAVGASVGVGY